LQGTARAILAVFGLYKAVEVWRRAKLRVL